MNYCVVAADALKPKTNNFYILTNLVDVVQLYLELTLPFITVDVSIWWKIYYIWAIYVSLYLPA